MFIPSFNRFSGGITKKTNYNYKDRQIRQKLSNHYQAETDIEVLQSKLKQVELSHQDVLKSHNESLRGLVDGRQIVDARKKLAENIKPVEFEKEIINARIDEIKRSNL